MDEILSILYIIGVSQGFILFLALAFKKGKTTENRFLACLVLLMAIDLIIAYYYKGSNEMIHESSLIGYSIDFFGYSLIFLYGPVIYLYVMKLTLQLKKVKLSHSLHLVPFLIIVAYSLFLFLYSKGNRNSGLYNFIFDSWEFADYLISLFMVASIASYLIPTYLYLKRFSIRIKEFYSSTGKITLIWLRAFILIFLVYTSLLLVFLIFMSDSKLGLFVYSDLYYIFMSLSVFILGYFAIAQPGIFGKIELMEQELKKNDGKKQSKYKKTKLEDEQSTEYLNTIISYVTESGSFTDPDMNLQLLGQKLEIAPHHISQVINSKLNKNFYQFINHYRVEEVKRVLTDPGMKHLSILEIAFESGFNTKSTFNSIFKQSTGMTPSQYRKTII